MRGILILILTSFLLPASVSGQVVVAPGDFVASGGSATSGRLTVFSSMGQAVSAEPMQGGGFSLEGGFLSTIPSIPALAISHVSPGSTPMGEPVTLEAQIDASVQQAEVHFRQGGSDDFTVIAMDPVAEAYRATISGDAVTSRGLVYYIAALDSLGRTVYSPFVGAYGVRVEVPDPGIVRDAPQPAGITQSAYRLVSIPIQPTNSEPAAVLEDDLGAYDSDVWRFFELSFNQEYVEFQNAGPIEIGKAYWLITSEAERVLDTGAGTTTTLDAPFRMPLHPRWNLIGVPFNYPLSVEQLSFGSGQRIALRSLDDGWNDPIQDPVTTLRPFEGYAIFNALQTVDTLVVQPFGAQAQKEAGQVIASKTDAAEEWSVHIAGKTTYGTDADNVAGVHSAARDDWDALDFPEPPMIGRHVSVTFSRPDWRAPSTRFSTDMRAPGSSGHEWEFEVSTADFELVSLTFDALESVPQSFEVWLIDDLAGVSQNLRDIPRYQIATAAGIPYQLRLAVGSDLAGSPQGEAADVPSVVAISEIYPNPFSSAAVVRFSLPEGGPVSVKVYDALGAEVATLLEGATRSEGSHLVVWDGLSASGRQASSGVYFVNLLAGNERITRKVVLVR